MNNWGPQAPAQLIKYKPGKFENSMLYVTFHRKTRLIEHFNLSQMAFQTPSNSVCSGVCEELANRFERVYEPFGKYLKTSGRSL